MERPYINTSELTAEKALDSGIKKKKKRAYFREDGAYLSSLVKLNWGR